MISRFRRDLVLDVIQDHVQTGLKCNCSSVCGVGGGGEGKSGGEGRIVEDSNCAKKKIDTQQVC